MSEIERYNDPTMPGLGEGRAKEIIEELYENEEFPVTEETLENYDRDAFLLTSYQNTLAEYGLEFTVDQGEIVLDTVKEHEYLEKDIEEILERKKSDV